MPFARIKIQLDAEQVRLDALLLETTPEPSNYEKYVIKKTLAIIGRMRQQTGESDADYTIRVNLACQDASAGNWSTTFFTQLEAAIASDTAEGAKGGSPRT